MKRFALLIPVILIVFLAGCSSMRVAVNYDDQFDFSGYKTFNFVVPKKEAQKERQKPATIKDPIFQKKASREIAVVLTEKGFEKVETARQADFLVAFYATAKNKTQITPPTYRIGRFGRRWVRPGRVRHYKQGTLIVDIVDREQKELVWRGVGSGALDPGNPTRNLLEAIEKVLKDFPPSN